MGERACPRCRGLRGWNYATSAQVHICRACGYRCSEQALAQIKPKPTVILAGFETGWAVQVPKPKPPLMRPIRDILIDVIEDAAQGEGKGKNLAGPALHNSVERLFGTEVAQLVSEGDYERAMQLVREGRERLAQTVPKPPVLGKRRIKL